MSADPGEVMSVQCASSYSFHHIFLRFHDPEVSKAYFRHRKNVSLVNRPMSYSYWLLTFIALFTRCKFVSCGGIFGVEAHNLHC